MGENKMKLYKRKYEKYILTTIAIVIIIIIALVTGDNMDRLTAVEKSIKQITCEHIEVKYEKDFSYQIWSSSTIYWNKVCKICDKKIGHIDETAYYEMELKKIQFQSISSFSS